MNSWLIFALLAPILWGFSNVLDCVIRREFVKNDAAMTFFLAATRIPLIIALFFIIGFEPPKLPYVIFMFLGGILWMLPFVFYYKTIEFEEPSRVVLLMQTTPVFVLLISFFAIGETLNINQIFSFILIITGGIFAGVKKFGGIWRLSRAFWILMLTDFLWSASDVAFKKFEPAFSGFLSAFAFYFLGSASVSLILFASPTQRKNIFKTFSSLPRRAWKFLIIDQTSGILGSAAFAYALTLGKASLTSVIISIQPLVVILFSLILAKFIKEIAKEDLSKTTLIFKGASLLFILAGLLILS